jgi:hypothetical protein
MIDYSNTKITVILKESYRFCLSHLIYILYWMTLSFGRVGLGCLTPLSFQQYFSYIVASIGDLWKPTNISKMTLIFKDHLSVYM